MRIRWSVLGAVIVGGALVAGAAVPLQFSVQGVLRDNMGALQSMTFPMVARFFDGQTAGTQYGGDFNLGSVPVVNGLFTVAVPAPNILTDLASAAAVWLELEINSEKYPRHFRELLEPGK